MVVKIEGNVVEFMDKSKKQLAPRALTLTPATDTIDDARVAVEIALFSDGNDKDDCIIIRDSSTTAEKAISDIGF